jgi:hypothetical protein
MASWEEDEGLRMRKRRLEQYVWTLEEIPQPTELINKEYIDNMAKKKQVLVTIDNDEYGDEGIVTKDRDLTQEEIDEILDKAKTGDLQDGKLYTPEEPANTHHSKALLKLKCSCGRICNVSDEVVEDGLSWSMVVGNDHYLTLHCDECGNELTMYLEEIVDNELPKESN